MEICLRLPWYFPAARITGRFVHKIVVFCFQLGHGLFKTKKYLIIRKVAEAVTAIFLLRRTSFLPLFFPNPRENPHRLTNGGDFH